MRRAGRHDGSEAERVEELDESLGDECDAYLAGRYLNWLLLEGLPVHPWAWFNRVAHAPFATIRRHVEQLGVPDAPCCYGHAALLIEAAIVATVEVERLPELQRRLLVPLELELMGEVRSPRAVVEHAFRSLL